MVERPDGRSRLIGDVADPRGVIAVALDDVAGRSDQRLARLGRATLWRLAASGLVSAAHGGMPGLLLGAVGGIERRQSDAGPVGDIANVGPRITVLLEQVSHRPMQCLPNVVTLCGAGGHRNGGPHRTSLRSVAFSSLPAALRGSGSSETLTYWGTLKSASRSWQCASTSPMMICWPPPKRTAPTFSPITASGTATTAASATPGAVASAFSTSTLEMFSPPRLMMSFVRSMMCTRPASSTLMTSPVCSQPSVMVWAVASGRFQ